MPWRKCFKLPRFKWYKKKNKKQDQRIKPFLDVTTSVRFDEVRQQHEPRASSTGNQDGSLNYSSSSNSSVNSRVEGSQMNPNEKTKDGGSEHSFLSDGALENSHVTQKNNDKDDDREIESQNSNISSEDNEVRIREEHYLKLLKSISNEVTGSSEEKSDSTVVPKITSRHQNTNEVLDANEEITNCTTTIMRIAEVSDIDEILEHIYIKKTYEIINKITVQSNVFEEIEKLKSFEIAGKNLHPELMQEEIEKCVSDTHIGDTECEQGDFHKSFKIHSKNSQLSFHSEIPQGIDYMDTVMAESNESQILVINDKIAVEELGYKHDSDKTSKMPHVISAGENGKIIPDELIVSMEDSNEIISETDENVSDLECESQNSDKYSEPDSDICEVKSEDETNYVANHTQTAEVSLKINENLLPAKETTIQKDLENNDDRREDNNNEIKIKSFKSEEIIKDKNVVDKKAANYILENNDKCREEKMNFMNIRLKTQEEKEKFVIKPDNFVNAEGSQTSTQTFDGLNLQVECKTSPSEEKISLDSTIKMDEYENCLSNGSNEHTNFAQYQPPKLLKIELFPSNENVRFTEKAISHEDTGNNSLLAEYSLHEHPPNQDLDKLSSNHKTNHFAQVDTLESYSDSSEEARNYINRRTSDRNNYSSFPKTENLYPVNDHSLHDIFENETTSNDSLLVQDRGDAFRKNSELEIENNETFICSVEKDDNSLANTNEPHKHKLETLNEKTNVLNKNNNIENVEKDKIDQDSATKNSDTNLTDVVKHTSGLHDPDTFDAMSRVLNSGSFSVTNVSLPTTDDLVNTETVSRYFHNNNSMLNKLSEFSVSDTKPEVLFNDSCQQSCYLQNKRTKLHESNTYRNQFHSYSKTEDNITANTTSFRNNNNYSTEFSKYSGKGKQRDFTKEITKISDEEIQSEYFDVKDVTDEEREIKTPEDKHFIKEINNKPFSNKFRKYNTLVISGNNHTGAKSLSKYSLSDSSYSSETSKLSGDRYSKVQGLNAEDADNFVINRSGDSGAEEIFFDDIGTIKKFKKTLQDSQESTELHHTLTISKKNPETRKGQKIKICITKKSSQKDKSKTEKLIHRNKKRISSLNKNKVKLDSGDHIKLVSHLNENNTDYKLNQNNKNNECKTSSEIMCSCDMNGDEIEKYRTESIKRFNNRKQKILSQMGPSLRKISIKNTDSIEFRLSEIEKLCLKTDVISPRKRNYTIKQSPDVHTFARTKDDKTTGMYEKSSLIINKVSEQGDSVKNNCLSKTNKDTSECDSIEGDVFLTKNKFFEKCDFICESETENLTEGSEKMTPVRRRILDSSRSIRSPKYLFPLNSNLTHKKNIYPFKPVFIKSTKQKVVAHLKDNEINLLKYKNGCKLNGSDYKTFELGSPRKRLTGNADDCYRQEHTPNYRATTPDYLKAKFDDTFKRYAGKGRYNGDLISYKRSTEWLRDAGVIGNVLSAEEATDAFKCAAGAKVALNREDFRKFLQKLTRIKRLNYSEVYDKLCEASSRCIEA